MIILYHDLHCAASMRFFNIHRCVQSGKEVQWRQLLLRGSSTEGILNVVSHG